LGYAEKTGANSGAGSQNERITILSWLGPMERCFSCLGFRHRRYIVPFALAQLLVVLASLACNLHLRPKPNHGTSVNCRRLERTHTRRSWDISLTRRAMGGTFRQTALAAAAAAVTTTAAAAAAAVAARAAFDCDRACHHLLMQRSAALDDAVGATAVAETAARRDLHAAMLSHGRDCCGTLPAAADTLRMALEVNPPLPPPRTPPPPPPSLDEHPRWKESEVERRMAQEDGLVMRTLHLPYQRSSPPDKQPACLRCTAATLFWRVLRVARDVSHVVFLHRRRRRSCRSWRGRCRHQPPHRARCTRR
jgi:hypothetical protein